MAGPEDLGIDLGGLAQNAGLLQLLTQLSLINKDRRKGPAQGVGDILSEQRSRKEMMADSYAPGAKYEAGFEPGGVADAWTSLIHGLGGPSIAIDEANRRLNPQSLDDLGNGADDAMKLGLSIRDSGDQAGPYDEMIGKIIQKLMPQDPAGASDAGRIPGGRPSGTTQPAYNPESAPGPMGGGPHRPNVPVMPPTDSSGSSASANFQPDATAAMVMQILQRAGDQAPVAGKDRKKWGANTPGSKHPSGYADGGTPGGTLIRVGERKPGDKKYATEEVVYAAPGTVVAPVPKGMENPSHEDALGLIIAQLAKEPQREVAPGGDMQNAAMGYITSSGSKGRANALSSLQNMGALQNSRSENTRDFGLRERQYFTQRDQGNRGLDQQGTKMNMDYDLGLRGLGERRYEADLGSRDSRYSVDKNYDLGNRNLSLNFQRAADEVRNWEAERDLKRQLGMRGLDIDQQKANQDFQLGSAQQAFQQIMAGITGSALPGVRAGRTPMLGLLG